MFDWNNARKLQESSNYKLLYCFTGFGLNSIQNINKESKTEPDARTCQALYPDSSKYSVSKLRALFP